MGSTKPIIAERNQAESQKKKAESSNDAGRRERSRNGQPFSVTFCVYISSLLSFLLSSRSLPPFRPLLLATPYMGFRSWDPAEVGKVDQQHGVRWRMPCWYDKIAISNISSIGNWNRITRHNAMPSCQPACSVLARGVACLCLCCATVIYVQSASLGIEDMSNLQCLGIASGRPTKQSTKVRTLHLRLCLVWYLPFCGVSVVRCAKHAVGHDNLQLSHGTDY